ncbi:hypothetical protein BV25DRAFT_1994681 [Artomyces pyxidatus]|uniref:Uncharacterized protein n=1 Tax=Artomyces pyxidatus TaxID=48021 RepID=A0ACB8SNJ1_9AGAM|nr:hypothetical protein BV25DRAFT_1994681 [Artomyces pyxidatus]
MADAADCVTCTFGLLCSYVFAAFACESCRPGGGGVCDARCCGNKEGPLYFDDHRDLAELRPVSSQPPAAHGMTAGNATGPQDT